MLSVGIDLVDVAAVTESVAVHAESYLERVYTPRELQECRAPDGTVDARRLAARFAAKEAAFKALGVGDDAIPWQSVGVRSDRFGNPSLDLTGAAAALAAARGIDELVVSLTHEGPFAAAVVVAQTSRGDGL